MSTVLIKQIPDDYSEATGLAKYNRSRMPGCKDIFQAAQRADDTYVTGLDAKLEETYGKDLNKDFSKTSSFWGDFSVIIEADKPKIFNTNNALDTIALKMLIANRYVAPDKESISNPKYWSAQYYAYTEEQESAEEISSYKKRDAARAKLLEISENKDKMLLYGQYLEGIKYNEKFKEDTLYKMLRVYIDDKDLKNANNFLEALKMSVEELQQKIVVDKALKRDLIRKVNVGNKKYVYQYGQITVGNTLPEVYTNLATPDFAPEFMSLKNEVEKR